MRRPILPWSIATSATGLLLAALAWYVRAQATGHLREELLWTLGGGACLLVLGIAGLLAEERLGRVLATPDAAGSPAPETAPRVGRHPCLTLAVASFCCLFLEVMLIRFAGSQIRIFSFYKNIPLISCYLGMGLGCYLRGGRPRHVVAFLLWLVPFTVALSLGSIAASPFLGKFAAVASSEQVLGDAAIFEASPLAMLLYQGVMGVFAVGTLAAITLLFVPLGRLLGESFQGIPRLRAYSVNILGSLAGVAVFMAASYLWTPPWVWFAIGLVPLFWWLGTRGEKALAAALVAASVGAVVPSVGETVWSPYQKLVGRASQVGPMEAYQIEISDVFYQMAIDLRWEKVLAAGRNPFPHYNTQFAGLPAGGRVVIVGAGSGNDVAAALRAGAGQVDAVDIDPAIVRMGREHHPERPYEDPRVRVIVDDARSAFRRLPAASYDAVVFGLLDSHTQLGVSSVRLDNYVFTLESFSDAARLLKPGGRLIVTAATFRDWFRERFTDMLAATCGTPVSIQKSQTWFTYSCSPSPQPTARSTAAALPTDDWPFLYLPSASVPGAYLLVLAMLALASVVILRALGLRIELLESGQWHMFFMGAAFLLVEVQAINRLALLFGSTWLVSAVTIALVLSLILGANLLTAARRVPYPAAYAGLFGSLAAAYLLNAGAVAGLGLAASVGYGLIQVLPVFFAGLIFARSFEAANVAGTALGANMLGAVLGGWVEYASMATGIRALLLLAMGLYLASAVALMRSRRSA